MLAGMVADAIIARGLQGMVTLSHLCVLAVLNEKIAGDLVNKLKRAEVTVVALPETNLFLQDRGEGGPIRRGVTLGRELRAAGVPVRLGTDNVRDWFFPFGDADMLDTALFATVAAHLDDEAVLIAAICDAETRSRRAIPPTSCSFVLRASMMRWHGGRRNAQCSRLDGRWLDRRGPDRSFLYLANGDHPDRRALAHPLALPRQSGRSRFWRRTGLVVPGGNPGGCCKKDVQTYMLYCSLQGA